MALVFPAHAGMNRSAGAPAPTPRCVPRTRGDEPAWQALLESGLEVFPAHAGMNRSGSSSRAPNSGVPRTRGDEPFSPALAWPW